MTRRKFLLAGAATGVAFSATRGLLAHTSEAVPASERKFYSILSLGRLGFHASFPESVDLAGKYGFEGLDPDPDYLASLSDDGPKRLLDDLQKRNLKFGAAGLPVDFRKDSATFNDGLDRAVECRALARVRMTQPARARAGDFAS